MPACPAFGRDGELLEPPAPTLRQRPLPFLRQSYQFHRMPLAAFAFTVHLALKRVHYHLDVIIRHLHIRNAGIIR